MVLVLSFWSCQKKIDIAAEKEAIKAVIEQETEMWRQRNFEGFKKSWAHKPYSFWLGASKPNFTEIASWDSIGTHYKEIFERSSEIKVKIKNENYMFRIYDDNAWVTFEQHFIEDTTAQSDEIPSKELRVLEKTEGEWKIIFVGYIGRNTWREPATEE
jgi:hypothetical protein